MPIPVPPVAKIVPLRREQLGRTRTDDYAWMKDDDWREVLRDPSVIKPDVKAYLEAENAYVKAMLASTEDLQATMFQEMKGRIKEDDSSVPAPDGMPSPTTSAMAGGPASRSTPARRSAWMRARTCCSTPTPCPRARPSSGVGAAEHRSRPSAVSPLAVDEQGPEVYHVFVKDLQTGEDPAAAGGERDRRFRVLAGCAVAVLDLARSPRGAPPASTAAPPRGGPADDVLVYEEPDHGFFASVHLTSSRAFVVLALGNQETSEARLIPASDPTSESRMVESRTEGLRYEVDHWGDRFVIRTNADGALDFKLVESAAAEPSRATWRDLAPHRPGRFIAGFHAYRDHLVRLERVEANNRLVVRARDGAEHAIAFDEEAYALSLEGGYGDYEHDGHALRPAGVADYAPGNGSTTTWARRRAPS